MDAPLTQHISIIVRLTGGGRENTVGINDKRGNNSNKNGNKKSF